MRVRGGKSGVRYRTARPPTSRIGTPRSLPAWIRSTAAGSRSSSLIVIPSAFPPRRHQSSGNATPNRDRRSPASEDAGGAGVVQTERVDTKPDADAEALTPEELQLAARNHGMPLEALRYPVTPVGMHYLLIHFDIPVVDAASYRLRVEGHRRAGRSSCRWTTCGRGRPSRAP